MANSKEKASKHSAANKPLPKSTRPGAKDGPFIPASKTAVMSHEVPSPVARTMQESTSAGMRSSTSAKTRHPVASRPNLLWAVIIGLLLGAVGGVILHHGGVLFAAIGAVVGACLGALLFFVMTIFSRDHARKK